MISDREETFLVDKHFVVRISSTSVKNWEKKLEEKKFPELIASAENTYLLYVVSIIGWRGSSNFRWTNPWSDKQNKASKIEKHVLQMVKLKIRSGDGILTAY